MERPDIHSDEFDKWIVENRARNALVDIAQVPIFHFAERASKEILSGVDDTNRIWSPVNAYLALAMTAELSAGETQEEVLRVLGVTNLVELRRHISTVWEDLYTDNR